MRHRTSRGARRLAVAAALLVVPLIWLEARQAGGDVRLDPDDIGGVVSSARGPEAGVWVIAETASLPTPMARMVVTDDRGRYLIPDLPRADYAVFVRGYGLVDSARQTARPGRQLNLAAVVAPTPAAAAQIYPPAYWLSMMRKPVGQCGLACHQIGNKATRELPPALLATSRSSLQAWDRRVAMGVEGPSMAGPFSRLGADREAFAEWTDRIARGELPRDVPARPAGVERNLVVTVWDWGTKLDGRTDAVASDLRNGSVNPNGPVYMVARSTDVLAILDPNEHRTQVLKVPSRAPERYTNTPESVYWGTEPVWKRRAEPRSLAMDERGRVWMTAMVREKSGQPAFCNSPANKFARHFPAGNAGGGDRQVTLFDPRTREFTPVADTCFSADHNNLGPDNYLYFGETDAVFWIDTATWDRTKDAEASQGWCPAVVDANGDGRITEWTEPKTPRDPRKDLRVGFSCYQVAVDPANKNGVAWCGDDRRLTRIERGPNPPETCRAEIYRPPAGTTPDITGAGEATIDGNGVVWVNWRGNQHFTSFDRRKCRTTAASPETGESSCTEGWSVHRLDVPTYEGTDVQADLTYLSQVDRHNTLGFGKDTPMYGTVNTEMLVAFLPQAKQFVKLRVPYPLGFFSRSANGRIDDPRAGWKGKGIWSSYSTYPAWHVEGGYVDGGKSGHGSKAVKFQMRPDPLAK